MVTRDELLAAGVSEDEIRHRLAIGSLIRAHRGVYRVGHCAGSVEGRYAAAVSACGAGAVLSGRAAGYWLGLIKGPPPAPEVTARGRRVVDGVKTRRSRREVETMIWRGIPVTAVARTLVDIAAELSDDALGPACHEAGVRFRTTPQHVERVLSRYPNARGAGRLRRIISGDSPVILSKLEKRFVARLHRAGLPLPLTNRPAGGFYVDWRWPRDNLTIELDSYRFHNTRHAWEQDRRREREAYARRDEFRRYTWGDVFEDPEQMLSELRELLSAARPSTRSGPSARP